MTFGEYYCAIGGTCRSDRVLSNCRAEYAPHRDVCVPQTTKPAVNDRVAQREIITVQTTRLDRPDTRYTIVIQYYAPRTQK